MLDNNRFAVLLSKTILIDTVYRKPAIKIKPHRE